MNELDIAHAIRDQELVSPQKYENVWLFDMRITGTGLAYRHRFEEFAWRDSSLYLNPEFLARCNGLPVILEHPKGNVLNTQEYQERNVGSVFLPYIKGDEVWGVVKIWDEPTAKLMLENQLSTSPAVVWRDPNANVQAEIESGEKFFVEGKPSLLDHLAICEQGVWDKGGEPTGVSTTAVGDRAMPDEVRKDDKAAAADSAAKDANDLKGVMGFLQKLETTFTDGMKSITTRMDSVEEKIKARADDATPKNRVLNDAKAKADDDDDDKGKDSKAKADDDDDDKGKDSKARKDEFPPKKEEKADAKAKADDDDDDKGRKDDDDDDKGKDSKSKADSEEEKPRKVQDDAVGDPKDLAVDSIVIRKADYDDLRSRLAKIEGAVPRQLSDDDVDAFARAQARADNVYNHFGLTASRPMHGEKLIDYRRRLVAKMQEHSPHWKTANLRIHAVDDASFTVIEDQIYAAAVDAARSPTSVPVGQLREHVETRGGHTYTRFYGRPISWMAPFAPNGRRVKAIRQPNKGGHVDA
jgi:hypothetical protein